MKRASLLIVSLVVLGAAALSASVKQAGEPAHASAPAAAARPDVAHAREGQPGDTAHAPAAPAAEAHAAPGAHEAAAGQHGEGGSAHGGESIWPMVARIFNFALLAGTLVYLLRSPFAAFLDTRKVQIRQSLNDAAATREDAAQQLAAIDRKLQALPGDLEALKRRGAAEIAAEEERIRAAAEVERQRMLENARREIARRVHTAERHLLNRAGELAVAIAGERVKRTITDADQVRLLDRYVEQVRPETMGS